MTKSEIKTLEARVIGIARHAGAEIMGWYASRVSVQSKGDKSPLTEADMAAHHVIIRALADLTPAIPVISEESDNLTLPDGASDFWLVDPLDGTKEFIKKTGEFTVNIALIRSGRPVLGVIYAPAIGLTFHATAGFGAWRIREGGQPEPIHVRQVDPLNPSVVASRDHAGAAVQEFVSCFPSANLCSMGSSLKFCMVAEGTADFYLRDVPTMEWDTAAAQCIVECAGGRICTLDGPVLTYAKPGFVNPSLMTAGDREFDWGLLLPGSGTAGFPGLNPTHC